MSGNNCVPLLHSVSYVAIGYCFAVLLNYIYITHKLSTSIYSSFYCVRCQELQDRTPMLQKQREDLDRTTEENKVLKSRYENVVEVGGHYVCVTRSWKPTNLSQNEVHFIVPANIYTHALPIYSVFGNLS